MKEDDFMKILEEHWKNEPGGLWLSPDAHDAKIKAGSTREVARSLLGQFDHKELREKFTAWKKGAKK